MATRKEQIQALVDQGLVMTGRFNIGIVVGSLAVIDKKREREFNGNTGSQIGDAAFTLIKKDGNRGRPIELKPGMKVVFEEPSETVIDLALPLQPAKLKVVEVVKYKGPSGTVLLFADTQFIGGSFTMVASHEEGKGMVPPYDFNLPGYDPTTAQIAPAVLLYDKAKVSKKDIKVEGIKVVDYAPGHAPSLTKPPQPRRLELDEAEPLAFEVKRGRHIPLGMVAQAKITATSFGQAAILAPVLAVGDVLKDMSDLKRGALSPVVTGAGAVTLGPPAGAALGYAAEVLNQAVVGPAKPKMNRKPPKELNTMEKYFSEPVRRVTGLLTVIGASKLLIAVALMLSPTMGGKRSENTKLQKNPAVRTIDDTKKPKENKTNIGKNADGPEKSNESKVEEKNSPTVNPIEEFKKKTPYDKLGLGLIAGSYLIVTGRHAAKIAEAKTAAALRKLNR